MALKRSVWCHCEQLTPALRIGVVDVKNMDGFARQCLFVVAVVVVI